MDVLKNEDIKTRKPHQCFGCLKTIPKGSIAHVQVNNDGGTLNSIYTHPACEKIIREMAIDMHYDDTYDEECVTQYLRDEGFEGTPEEYITAKETR